MFSARPTRKTELKEGDNVVLAEGARSPNASGDAMSDAVKTGTIFIEPGTLMPKSLLVEGELYSSGWTSVRNLDRYQLDRAIKKTGWTFFYLAGEIKATVFGFDKQKTVRTAVKRLTTNVKAQHLNCLEITRVATNSFLGVPYASVTGHARHIQEGLVLSGQ